MSQIEEITISRSTIDAATRDDTLAIQQDSRATLDKMIAMSEKFDLMKSDHLIPANAIHWNTDANMWFSANDDVSKLFGAQSPMIELSPDDLAFRHLCSKLGNLPPGYLLKCPPVLRSSNLNHWHSQMPDDKQWLIRAFNDRARAVVSDRYHAINNTDVLRMTRELLQGMNYTLIRPYITPHTLIAKIRVADTDDGNYGIGIEIRNGEITNYKLGVFPFIQRHACTNSIVYHSAGWQQRHNAHSDAGLRAAFKDNAGRALGIPSDMLNRIVEAEIEEIPNLTAVLDGICKKHGFNKDTRDLIAIGTEGQSTVMGVVNGVSFAAHRATSDQIDDDSRTKMEHLAGEMLMGDFFKVAMHDLDEDAGIDESKFAFVR